MAIMAGDDIRAVDLTPEEWQALPLLNSWTPRAGSLSPRFRYVPLEDRVDLYGAAGDGVNANGAEVAQLPSYCWPPVQISIPLATNRGYTVVANITADGKIVLSHVLSNSPTTLNFASSYWLTA